MNFFSTKVAFASLDSFLGKVNGLILNPLIELLFAVALVLFLYGVLEFIFNQSNDEKKTSGKSHMLWGIVGLTIMIGVWTILNVIIKTFDIEGVDPEQGTVNLPEYVPSRSPSGN